MVVSLDPLFSLLLNDTDLLLQLDRKGVIRRVVTRQAEPLSLDANRIYSAALPGKNIRRFFRIPGDTEIRSLALSIPSRIELLSPERLFAHECVFPSVNAFEQYDALYAFYSSLPFSRLYLRHFEGPGLFGLVRFIQVDGLLNSYRRAPILVLDEAGSVKGINRTFMQCFGAAHSSPTEFLERPAGDFVSPSPLFLQTRNEQEFLTAREGRWKVAGALEPKGAGPGQVSQFLDTGALRQEGGDWIFSAPEGGVRPLRIMKPADETKFDCRIEADLDLRRGELPCFILNGARQLRDFVPDIDGYLVGPEVTGRFLQVKKEGEVVHQVPADIPTPLGRYRVEMVRCGPLFAYFVNGKLLIGYRDPSPNQHPQSIQYLYLRNGAGVAMDSIRMFTRLKKDPEDFAFREVRLINGTENTYRFHSFIDRYRFLRRGDNIYYAYVLEDITLLKKNISLLSRERDRYRTLAMGEEASGPLVLGESAAMLKVRRDALRMAQTQTTVLIEGETGTGKEVLAHFIHANSLLKSGPFIKVDCASIPATLLESELFGVEKGAFTGATESRSGKLEAAAGGTLFLDEIENLDHATQAKLLGFLQDFTLTRLGSNKKISVETRVVAASNQPLGRLVAHKRFRSDLYYRLNAMKLVLPPLRDRFEDIPLLAVHFLKVYGEKFGRSIGAFSREALQKLAGYSWPGNIREMENAVQKAVLFCDAESIEPRHLDLSTPFAAPGENEEGVAPKGDARGLRKAHVEALLEKHNFIIERAAREAEVSRTTFYRKIRAFNIVRS